MHIFCFWEILEQLGKSFSTYFQVDTELWLNVKLKEEQQYNKKRTKSENIFKLKVV